MSTSLALRGLVALAAALASASAAQAAAIPATPAGEQTNPYVRPAHGGTHRVFTLRFTVREAPENEEGYLRSYTVGLSRADEGIPRCLPAKQPTLGETTGTLARAELAPPPRGWCPGRYTATVYLERRPACQGPPQASDAIACPLFIALTDTGQASFFVRSPAHSGTPTTPPR